MKLVLFLLICGIYNKGNFYMFISLFTFFFIIVSSCEEILWSYVCNLSLTIRYSSESITLQRLHLISLQEQKRKKIRVRLTEENKQLWYSVPMEESARIFWLLRAVLSQELASKMNSPPNNSKEVNSSNNLCERQMNFLGVRSCHIDKALTNVKRPSSVFLAPTPRKLSHLKGDLLHLLHMFPHWCVYM